MQATFLQGSLWKRLVSAYADVT
jgi:proliferating cell nuclear antigen PCNA